MATRKKACDICHRRKIQCDGAVPQCTGCKNHGLPCTFNRETGLKKRATKAGGTTKSNRNNAQNDLAKRMERIEQMLQAAKRAREDILPIDADPTPPSAPTLDHTPDSFQESPSTAYSASSGSTPQKNSAPRPARRDFDSAQASIGWMRPRGGGAPVVHPVNIGSARVSFGKLHFVGLDLGEISSYNGIPFFSEEGLDWIRLRCGTEPSFESALAIASMSHQEPNSDPSGPTGATESAGSRPLWQTQPDGWWQEQPGAGDMPAVLQQLPHVGLPPKSTVERYATAYRMSQLGISFPLVDPVLFAETVELAYSYLPGDRPDRAAREILGSYAEDELPEDFEPLQYYTKEQVAIITARAMVYALISLVGPISVADEEELPVIDGDAYSAAAHNMLPLILPGGSIPALETVICLTLYCFFTGQVQATSMFHSTACRMVFILGGHTEQLVAGADPDSLTKPLRGMTLEKPDKGTASSPEERSQMEDRAERARRQIRQLFRVCYIIDKELALRTGLPPSIHDEYCDLDMLERSWSIDLAGLPIHQREGRDRYPVGMTLYEEVLERSEIEPYRMQMQMLKSKVSRLLYSHASNRKTDAEILRDIRELDAELDRWRASVPPKFRPRLGSSRIASLRPLAAQAAAAASGGQHHYDPGASPASGSDRSFFRAHDGNTPSPPCAGPTQQPGGAAPVDDPDDQSTFKEVLQHFEYHYLMASIHQASGRCQAWSNVSGEPGRELAVVSSSHALSVQASRSALVCMRAATKVAQGMNFWMTIFYPMSSMITVFCNILLMPLECESADDLALLESVLEVVLEMGKTRRLTPNEVVHIKILSEFVSELARLARCAIAKAAQEAAMAANGIPG